MNDTQRLQACAYTLGFTTGALMELYESKDWDGIENLVKYLLNKSNEIFYEKSFVDKECFHESDGKYYIATSPVDGDDFYKCVKCGEFYE